MRIGIVHKIQRVQGRLHLRRILRLIWSVSNGRATFIVLMLMIESALFFTSIYIFRLLVDSIAKTSTNPGQTSHYLVLATIITVLYVIIKPVTSLVTEVQASHIREFIDDKIHQSAVRLDLPFFDSPSYFDTMKRAKDSGPDRPKALLVTMVELVKNGLLLLVMGVMLVSISWVLFPIMALFILPTLLVRTRFAGRLHQLRWKNTEAERKAAYVSNLITEDTAAKEIKIFGLGNYLRNLYLDLRLNIVRQQLHITKQSTISEVVTSTCATLGFFTCIIYICLYAGPKTQTVGSVTLFLFVFPQLFSIMQALSNGISTLYQNAIFVSNLFHLFDLQPTLQEPSVPQPITASGDLETRDLHFTYPHARFPTLENINLTVPAGKIVAVVGLNGAGKTTLIKLLCRLYDPTKGAILLGGSDIRCFTSSDYHKQVSVVFQDFVKFNVSAADNIRFGAIHAEADSVAVREASERSGAHAYIKTFPNGYSTVMGRVFEEGQEISIGQWQKLAIARAFYSESRFIIFDEATSALDAVAEHDLFQSLRQSIGGRGILIISHRLSAVKHADYIYVMADGRIQQEGTHEELISQTGDYARIFSKEARSDKAVAP